MTLTTLWVRGIQRDLVEFSGRFQKSVQAYHALCNVCTERDVYTDKLQLNDCVKRTGEYRLRVWNLDAAFVGWIELHVYIDDDGCNVQAFYYNPDGQYCL